MKTMAWRLLSLLLFYSLAVVWADDSACWTSIKMLEITQADSRFERRLQPKPLTFWRQSPKTSTFHDWPKDSKLSDPKILKTLAEKAGIKEFNRMNCYAAPDKSGEVEQCHEMAFQACSEDSKSVKLIYQIQQQQKDRLQGSLLQVSKIETKKQLITVLFIDCQNPTDMDMDDNPTECHGGVRLEFDPTFSKAFPRSQIEIRSDGNLSDTEIYPGGLLAQEKVKGNFLMKLDDEISSDCGPTETFSEQKPVRAISATNDGVVLLDSRDTELMKMTQECVFKNELPEGEGPAQRLSIHRENKDQVEYLELQPQESVRVNPLSHIEIYPFFSVPEQIGEAREDSEKPLYAFHLKLIQKKPKEGDKEIVIKTEKLKHENWFLKTLTCWNVLEAGIRDCFAKMDAVLPPGGDVRRIFVSSGHPGLLRKSIAMAFASCKSESDWKLNFKEKQAKYKFIKVGESSTESEIPDPILVPRRRLPIPEKLKRWLGYEKRKRWLSYEKLKRRFSYEKLKSRFSYEKLKRWFSSRKQKLKGWFSSRKEKLKRWFSSRNEKLKRWFSSRKQKLKDWFSSRKQKLKDWFSSRKQKMKGMFSKLFGRNKGNPIENPNETPNENPNEDRPLNAIEVQPPPVDMKGGLNLDVALFYVYRPLQASFVEIKASSLTEPVACLNISMEMMFYKYELKLYMRKRTEKGDDNSSIPKEFTFGTRSMTIDFGLQSLPTLFDSMDESRPKTKLRNISKMTFETSDGDSRMQINCHEDGWAAYSGENLNIKDNYVDITFLEIDYRSTAIFSEIQI